MVNGVPKNSSAADRVVQVGLQRRGEADGKGCVEAHLKDIQREEERLARMSLSQPLTEEEQRNLKLELEQAIQKLDVETFRTKIRALGKGTLGFSRTIFRQKLPDAQTVMKESFLLLMKQAGSYKEGSQQYERALSIASEILATSRGLLNQLLSMAGQVDSARSPVWQTIMSSGFKRNYNSYHNTLKEGESHEGNPRFPFHKEPPVSQRIGDVLKQARNKLGGIFNPYHGH